jgi:hypothetical protein
VRRYLHHLAPGIALANPERVETLTRALGRQDITVEQHGAPEIARPTDLSAAECATLLAACASYRQHAPDGLSPDSLAQLEQRLRAGLPFERRLVLDTSAPPALDAPRLTADDGADVRLPVPAVALPMLAPAQPAHAETLPNGASQCGSDPLAPALRWPAPLVAAWLAVWLMLGTLLAGRWRRLVSMTSKLDTPAAPTADSPMVAALLTAELDPAVATLEAATQVASQAAAPDPHAYLPTLHQAIERRQPLEIVYRAVEGPATTRTVRPLRLESHGDTWYLHAYCLLRRDERVFRVDRIAALRLVRLARRRGRPSRQEQPEPAVALARPRRVRAAPPRASFFAPPPTPPPGSPLVRVWLAD